MVEKLLDIVKLFFERYLISSIFATILSFITFYITPETYNLLIKFGLKGYCVFVFLVWFLIVLGIKQLCSKISNIVYTFKSNKYLNSQNEKENKIALELLWTYVDKLSIDDYKLLIQFIDTNNQPHVTSGIACGNCLLNSDWVHKTQIEGEQFKGRNLYETSSIKTAYILHDDIFQALKYSKEKYGKISHITR